MSSSASTASVEGVATLATVAFVGVDVNVSNCVALALVEIAKLDVNDVCCMLSICIVGVSATTGIDVDGLVADDDITALADVDDTNVVLDEDSVTDEAVVVAEEHSFITHAQPAFGFVEQSFESDRAFKLFSKADH